MGSVTPSYKGFRYPAEIISHCVWLYHRFPLSFREVEEMMMERGVVVSHETIRQWCAKFGQTYESETFRGRQRMGVVADQCRWAGSRAAVAAATASKVGLA